MNDHLAPTAPTAAGVTRRRVLGMAAAAAAGAAVGVAPSGAQAVGGRRFAGVDTVLHGGQVLSLDRRFMIGQAVAIRDGRIVRVGDDRDMRRLIGRKTEVVNLRGRTAMPGINDSHLHGVRTGLSLPPYNLDVGSAAAASIAEIAQTVATAAQSAAPGAWIRGKGWNASTFAENRDPRRQDLDGAAPDNPVVLIDWSNHVLWANSKALEVAGITASTVAPPDGVIVKDAAGQPTGLFYETAMRLIGSAVPAFSRDEQAQALRNHLALALSYGITSYTEPGIGSVTHGIYRQLAAEGTLSMRVTALLSRADDVTPVNADQVREILANYRPSRGIDPRRFAVAGVKLRADGVPIASRTAWMREPYIGGGRGSMVTEGSDDAAKVAQLAEMIELVHRADLQVGTHATGDAAIDATAAAYARARRRGGKGQQRHYVIHGDFTWPETLRLLARNDCSVSFNPSIKRLICDTQPSVVGDERAAYETPYASALRAGVVTASASDAPNVSAGWLQGLEAAILREGTSGRVSGPSERIGVQDALRSYTTAGAWQDHAERWKGSLEPGKVADICVLGDRLLSRRGDDLALAGRDISDLPIDLTMVDGEVAYDSGDARARQAAAAARATSWAVDPHPGGMCASC